MTTFDDKEKAAENRYAHDQETAFRVHARRNKLLGLWAAGQLGLEKDEAERYAKDVLNLSLEAHSDTAMVDKICFDVKEKGLTLNVHDIRAEMHRLNEVAREQLGG